MLKRFLPYLIIIFLFIVAVLLGFEIYASIFNPKISILKIISNKQATSTKNLSNEQVGDSRFIIDADLSKLTPDEYQRLITTLGKEAKTVDSLTVSSNCQVEPFVFNINNKQTITIKNTDSRPHTLTMVEEVATISAGKSVEVASPKLKSGSTMRYGCDYRPSGYLFQK